MKHNVSLLVRVLRHCPSFPRSFRGPSEAREPGIHNPNSWLWIPGSPLRAAPE